LIGLVRGGREIGRLGTGITLKFFVCEGDYNMTRVIEEEYMVVTIERSMAYAHRLLHHKGKCRFLHGHNAKIVVSVGGPVDLKTGMVVDFRDLKEIVDAVLEEFDHHTILGTEDDLGSVLQSSGQIVIYTLGEPTAENLSKIIFKLIEQGIKVNDFKIKVESVKFYETPTSFATYGGIRI